MNVYEALIRKGYKEYSSVLHGDSRNFQKRVESDRVCSLNDKLCIHFHVYDFEVDGHKINSCKAEIKAEFYDVWWKICCYSLPFDSVINDIETIERRLITMFNSIPE